jgi:hypothetical protein
LSRGIPVTDEQLADWFTYHSPKDHPNPNVDLVYETIRTAGYEFATILREHVPAGPDLTTAIRCIREAVMWANAAVALQTPEPKRAYADGALGPGPKEA